MTTNKTTSEYAREFDKNCIGWTEDRLHNIGLLLLYEHYFDAIFRTEGKLYLNDVYRELGIPEEDKYSKVGWLRGSDGNDGYVDFGLIGSIDRKGEGSNVMLDFNVDGTIDY